MKKDQAPTRVVPVEAGRSGSGESGPQVSVLKTLQMETEQLTKCQCAKHAKHSMFSAEGHYFKQ